RRHRSRHGPLRVGTPPRSSRNQHHGADRPENRRPRRWLIHALALTGRAARTMLQKHGTLETIVGFGRHGIGAGGPVALDLVLAALFDTLSAAPARPPTPCESPAIGPEAKR